MKSIKMIIFLMATFTICTLLLAGANLAYQKAANIFNIHLYKTILELFQISATQEEAENLFMENFEIKQKGKTVYYVAKGVEPGSVVFKTQGPGLWSRIEILLALYPDFEHLFGLRVLAQAETPGLGGRITEQEFQEQFKGVEIRPELKIVKFASAANEVNAITGASKTGQALEVIINRGIDEFDQAFLRQRTE